MTFRLRGPQPAIAKKHAINYIRRSQRGRNNRRTVAGLRRGGSGLTSGEPYIKSYFNRHPQTITGLTTEGACDGYSFRFPRRATDPCKTRLRDKNTCRRTRKTAPKKPVPIKFKQKLQIEQAFRQIRLQPFPAHARHLDQSVGRRYHYLPAVEIDP